MKLKVRGHMTLLNPGLRDSFGAVEMTTTACPECGATLKVNGGDCLSCLLRAGLDEENGDDSEESLAELLTSVDVRDSDWRLGSYQILEEIGRGGMGVIYRARQRHTKRIVALKRVLSHHSDSSETLERFRREAEAAASLDHPNILPIWEVGEADGLPFFTMKLATGGSLQQLRSELRDNPRECVRLMAKVARAVDYAHREGILHRDLKPGNILLDWRGEPMVSDFGLAKWVDATSDLTRSLAIFGTPGFIAPEQASGPRSSLTAAADVYSLGAILFDLIAGRAPFLGEHALAVVHQASAKTAPKLRSVARTADRDIETICAKCLELEPGARYRSAGDLAEDLERWLEERPIVARPVLPPARLWRWTRRNPAMALTIAACIGITTAATTYHIQRTHLRTQVAAQLAAQRSVTVVPLVNLDTGRADHGLTSKLGASLHRHLRKLGPATVEVGATIAPSRSPAASGASASRTLLTGTLRTYDGKHRVSLHLLDRSSGDRLLHRLVEVDQQEPPETASATIAQALYPALSAPDLRAVAEPTTDPGLLDEDVRSFIRTGVDLVHRRSGVDIERGLGLLRHAITLQPESAAAHAALARSLALKCAFLTTMEPAEEAVKVGRKAVSLDDRSPAAHTALAGALYTVGQVRLAFEHAFTAFELDPGTRDPSALLSMLYRSVGRHDLTLAWGKVADTRARAPGEGDAVRGDTYTYLLEDERAERSYQRYLKLHPDQPTGWMGIARLRLLQGRPDEARAVYQQHWKDYNDFSYAAQMAAQVEFFSRNFPEAEKLYAQLYERNPDGGGGFYGAVSYGTALGRIRMESAPEDARALLEGAREELLRRLQRGSENSRVAYELAAVEATLGDTEAALQHLRTSSQLGWNDFRSLHLDPRFDSIRDQPEYRAIYDASEQMVLKLRSSSTSTNQENPNGRME
jgi:tetratricopeptide (TPR) repeat protein/tRNA A-37 threonylcarbamoyl transferase component Bud32